VKDLADAELSTGWLSKLLTHPIEGLQNYQSLMKTLTEAKGAIKLLRGRSMLAQARETFRPARRMRDVSRNVEAAIARGAENPVWAKKTFMRFWNYSMLLMSGSRKAASREASHMARTLFDLIFVAAVAQVGDPPRRLFLRSTVALRFPVLLICGHGSDTPSIPLDSTRMT